jgi:hypothetical protein
MQSILMRMKGPQAILNVIKEMPNTLDGNQTLHILATLKCHIPKARKNNLPQNRITATFFKNLKSK